LGGIPDLPPDFKWPEHEYGDYRFIAQFNLSEISRPVPHLPEKGVLSIFIADDEEGRTFWGDDGYAKVFYFDHEEKLEPYSIAPSQPSVPVKLEPSIAIPLKEELMKDCPFDEEQIDDFDFDFIDDADADRNSNYLLGYPFYSSLAYDPRPGENWINLLTLSSEDDLDWCWHDGAFLMLFIEKEKLEIKDFSYIKSDAG
jgi:uncharacterized protein YwqG